MLGDAYLPSLLDFLKKLSPEILKIYAQHSLEIKTKSDHSPVTEADLISHKAIVEFLKKLTPDIAVISEESENQNTRDTDKFWLVDPLDGTREFIAKTDDFSINIALIENHIPILGIIYAPVFDVFYFALKNSGAYKKTGISEPQRIQTRKLNSDLPVVIASRRHGDNQTLQDYLKRFKDYERLSRGSAIKFGLIAEGTADIYPRFGDTSFWDTAAGQCIVEEAGGQVIDTKGQPLRYNAVPPYLNPHFLATGDRREQHDKTR
ncbi:MAG TPA: 3'(2'),5'-bisphosphate nucleotidase CysQ [Gammaproteobacteria bacterium]|nr:3'(2'),5'-bisphosphate nucleotidase CysQ [Gammaproteobacteria bacterium]